MGCAVPLGSTPRGAGTSCPWQCQLGRTFASHGPAASSWPPRKVSLGHFAQDRLPPVISGVPPQQQLSSPSVHPCVPAPQFVPRCITLLLSHLLWDTAVGRSGVSPAARAMVVALTGSARGCPWLEPWSVCAALLRLGATLCATGEPRWHDVLGCVWAGVREAEATSVPALSPPWPVPVPSACFCRTSSSQQLFAKACGQLALPAPAIALQESGRFSRPLPPPQRLLQLCLSFIGGGAP